VKWADVNVLVGAFRVDAVRHHALKAWLDQELSAPHAFAISSVTLASFVRVVTHPGIFPTPSPIERALEFCEAMERHPMARPVEPGPLHGAIFRRLCVETPATGKLVPDAWNAALALEHGLTFITLDRDYQRFAGLRWASPFDDLGPGGYYIMETRAHYRVPVRHDVRARASR
jgi:hypothetical protein